ncbi:MAG: aldo/keto reductase [Oscillospiraceae bacterium]|nr:aldo/keto reductase [Oscillospiraceae bacterium]
MRYTNFHGESLSLLGLGVMRMPQEGEGWGMPIIHDAAEAVLDACVAAGINYFDTGYIYHGGESEAFLGKALAKYPRDSFYVADKYNLGANPDYRGQFEEQLERLQMERIDFYLLHGISDDAVDDYLGNGCIEYFLEQKQLGRIKYLGFSFHGTPPVMTRTLAHCPWDFAMIQLNYYDWFHGDAKNLYEQLRAKEIPVMVMEPVHGGLLASLPPAGETMLREVEPEQSIASWALRFAQGLPGVAVVLSGMSNLEQVRDNVATTVAAKPLTVEDEDLLLAAGTCLKESISAACTACRYCLPDCPQGLDIPLLLGAYNEYKENGPWRLFRLNALPVEKRPGACTACGVCVGHCPQNLEIPAYLGDMAKAMEGLKEE